MDNVLGNFNTLPKDIKNLIFSFLDLDLPAALRLQSVSSEFKSLCWACLRQLDLLALANKTKIQTITDLLITRTNPIIVRFNEYHSVDTVLKAIKTCPNLEQISWQTRELFFDKIISAAELHPKLHEIIVQDKLDRRHYYRTINFVQNQTEQTRKFKLLSTLYSNKYRYFYKTDPLFQQKPIAFHRAYHRGGTVGSNMHVIGATDGTLTFLTLDTENKSLKIHSTDYTSHKDCINAIWAGVELFYKDMKSRASTDTYIASKDGIVTRWSCVGDAPVHKRTFVFPESILLVCEYESRYVLAAGKRTLYIADIDTSKIIRDIGIDDDITGLVNAAENVMLSTTTSLHQIKDVTSKEDTNVLQKVAGIPCPNLSISPEASLMVVARQKNVSIIQRGTFTEKMLDDVSNNIEDVNGFDTRPLLVKVSPGQYWATVSVGSRLVTYCLEIQTPIVQLAPYISPLEDDPEHPPICNSFWYSPCGTYLFGLFSNNTLYWWEYSVDKSF